jgi:phage gp36-like protein
MYCTTSDIRRIMPESDLLELTDDRVPPVSIDEDVVTRAITDAGELIDGYLRSRYTLPLAPMPGLLNTLAVDIAVYRLYSRRLALIPPEEAGKRYANAIKILEQIQAGTILLGAEAAGGGLLPSTGGPRYTAPPRVFGRETLEDYR